MEVPDRRVMKKLDYYIITLFTLTICFTIAMIVIFCKYSYIPDTLATCWFSYIVGELLCCALIKTVGERQANRKDVLEDRAYYDLKEKEQNGLEHNN